MEKIVEPKYDSFQVLTEWVSQEDQGWWGKEIMVYVVDQSVSANSVRHEIGEVLYLVVCSQSFFTNPNDEVNSDDLRRALVLEKFTPDKVEE